MLSPDNYVQAAGFTQSYNRYSYCVNNPLKYTDPSGWQSLKIEGYPLSGIYSAKYLETIKNYQDIEFMNSNIFRNMSFWKQREWLEENGILQYSEESNSAERPYKGIDADKIDWKRMTRENYRSMVLSLGGGVANNTYLLTDANGNQREISSSQLFVEFKEASVNGVVIGTEFIGIFYKGSDGKYNYVNTVQNAQGGGGHGNNWAKTGFGINSALDNSLTLTSGAIVGAQKLANSVANTTYKVITEVPILHTLGRLTGAVSIADNFMKFRQNPSGNWWNGVEGAGQLGFYFFGGAEAELIFNLGTMGIDAGIGLWNYSTQPQLNPNKK
jgi:hypothetical protein